MMYLSSETIEMERTVKKKTAMVSLGIAMIFLSVSFTSVVGFQAINSSQDASNSPLYHLRLENVLNQKKNPSYSSSFLGKGNPAEIPIPTREVITMELLDQLSTDAVKEKVSSMGGGLGKQWDTMLAIARSNLAELNSIIRQDSMGFQGLVNSYYKMSKQDVQGLFLEQMKALDVQGLKNASVTQGSYEPQRNITSGPICNITSGQLCQITSQPICKITTQPICLVVTKGVFCWTVLGPLCPTAGIKCNPPTTHPKLCDFFTHAGKLLKAILTVLLAAAVVLIPLAVISLALITAVNPDRCAQIHDKITSWFNCTAPGAQ
jgi:hypothetical protein